MGLRRDVLVGAVMPNLLERALAALAPSVAAKRAFARRRLELIEGVSSRLYEGASARSPDPGLADDRQLGRQRIGGGQRSPAPEVA